MARLSDRARRGMALIPAVLYYVGIFWLSSRSSLPAVSSFPLSDKAAHALVFAGFGVALGFGFGRIWPDRPRAAFGAAFALGLLSAVLDEFHQAFVPLRNPDVWDAAADAVGILTGLAVLALIVARRRASSRVRD